HGATTTSTRHSEPNARTIFPSTTLFRSLTQPTQHKEAAQPVNRPEPPGRIHGHVTTADGRPIAGASVRIVDDGIVVDLQTTNEHGEFTSRLLLAGRYRIEVVADGIAAVVDGVEVKLGRTTPVTVPGGGTRPC